MGDLFASGNWHVRAGQEEEFVQRWKAFLGWTREAHPSMERATLIRDAGNAGHFLSFAEWADPAGRNAWREDPGFMEHFSACRELCDDFQGGDFNRTVTV